MFSNKTAVLGSDAVLLSHDVKYKNSQTHKWHKTWKHLPTSIEEAYVNKSNVTTIKYL